MRGVTIFIPTAHEEPFISIHTPREGSDSKIHQKDNLSRVGHLANFDNFPVSIPLETAAIQHDFAENMVRILLLFYVYLGFALKNQGLIHFHCTLCTEMLRLCTLIGIQIIKAQ